MNTGAIYHRPESEFGYLYTKDTMHIRLQVAKNDVSKVELLAGDPYLLDTERWFEQPYEMDFKLQTELFDYYNIEISAKYKRLSYMFKVTGLDGSEILYTDQGIFPAEETYYLMPNNYFRMPYFHEIDRFKAPDWVKQTVWYQIFPERFANGDQSNDPEGVKEWNPNEVPDRQDFYGGDLQGVIDHLDHLQDLGINGIYFCPIFKANSNHKYDTEDYLHIDPSFGDKEIFKKLVDECHSRGIKVMLDAVFNHMGDTSPQWQDVLKNGKDSRYADWFQINEFPVSYTETEDFEYADDATYDTFAFTPHMPKLNTANVEVQDFLLNIAEYWIKEFDIDAWRLDVANEVDHNFWKRFRRRCDRVKKDFYILGEIWHSSQSWLQGDEFTAVMNYAYTDAIIGYFVHKNISLDKMVSVINSQLMKYRRQTNQMMFNILDSHDTPRILTLAQDDKDLVKQTMAFTYIQPGVPCLYYGDEYGVTGSMDPDCRRCMPWGIEDQDQDMYTFVKKLIRIRRDHDMELSESDLIWELVDQENGVIELQRGNLKAVFNAGIEVVEFSKGKNILLSNLVNENIMEPKGFVIYLED